jgi:CRISPR-associated protein Csm5
MRYRLTCLTPLLVGDGRKLSPIDYMVWKDQVNVLDQWRIFRLLAKGPRLDGYLAQLKRADKLDFASWGGFAQNFAGRRIPFESPTYSAYWNSPRALPDRISPEQPSRAPCALAWFPPIGRAAC